VILAVPRSKALVLVAHILRPIVFNRTLVYAPVWSISLFLPVLIAKVVHMSPGRPGSASVQRILFPRDSFPMAYLLVRKLQDGPTLIIIRPSILPFLEVVRLILHNQCRSSQHHNSQRPNNPHLNNPLLNHNHNHNHPRETPTNLNHPTLQRNPTRYLQQQTLHSP